ncbi:MAG: molecular chaperone HtpG [Candidatus Pacebacteria bacterium]|nr:molecular chaperone HtpG [Candidatus Paceibacterota bacterium]
MSTKRRKFKTEVQHLLNLVIHSLYTNREIFLRELISNASDAIDRARFESLSDNSILENDPDWKITIRTDKDAKTITISDNGIGMNPEEVDKNIGTIASSGTRYFLEQMEKADGQLTPELIGQFGVGFYSAFMVADKVTVITRRAGDPANATRWESTGSGSYTVAETTKDKRGTDVVLHLKDDMTEYLDEWKIRQVVKKYSDFVEHPVTMDVTREEKVDDEGDKTKTVVKEETLNSQKAIWARPRNEITQEEYSEFYKHVSHDFQDPLKVIHWNVEGATEFRALLFLPEKAPFDFFTQSDNQSRGIQLYVKRVFITDNCEALVPSYLRFLRGVVDSSDLPLNISRETLQEEKVIRIIRKNLIKKVLDTLEEVKDKDRDQYVTFWKEFGKVLKEGIHLDLGNRERLQHITLFESSKTDAGSFTSMDDYIERMPEEQEAIYYITGESRELLEQSPLLEAFRKHEIEVLLMTDPVDEWVVQSMTSYQDKPLKSIAKGDIDVDAIGKDEEEIKEAKEKTEKQYKQLIAFFKDTLKDKVKDIKLSQRLTDSPCCLVSDEADMGVHMEKILKALHKDLPPTKRILEINPQHPLLKTMNSLIKNEKKHYKAEEYAELLYDQALLTANLPLEDPLTFAKRVSQIMASEGSMLSDKK